MIQGNPFSYGLSTTLLVVVWRTSEPSRDYCLLSISCTNINLMFGPESNSNVDALSRVPLDLQLEVHQEMTGDHE